MEVRLKDCMQGNFRFMISDKFRIRLFEKAIKAKGGVTNLAKFLRCGRNGVRIMQKGRIRFIKWRILSELIEITNISELDVEKNVLAIKAGKSGRTSDIKFPVKESPELALLVAKGMGDGSIEKNFRFSFWNNEVSLIDEVCELVIKAMGNTKITVNKLVDGRIQAKCNPFVGLVLHLNGVPAGNKTLQEFDVPDWIKNGAPEIKSNFIRGLFDDESTVAFDVKNHGRSITIVMSKLASVEKSLDKFLNSIRSILSDLDIESAKVRKWSSFVDRKERKKILLGFTIRGKENLRNFSNKIGFTHPRKDLILKKAIKSFKNIHGTKELIFNTIMNSSRPLSTSEVTNITGINRDSVFAHLDELSKNGKLLKSKGRKPSLWFKEDTSSIISKKEEIMQTIIEMGPLSVKEISQITEINEKTVFLNVGRLSKENLIKNSTKQNVKSGRHPFLWVPY